MSFSKIEANNFQFRNIEKCISGYREDFKGRSGGFALPNVHLVGVYRSKLYSGELKPGLLISLPVCNQEKIIDGVLCDLFTNISVSAKMVIVIDYCLDDSESVIRNLIENFKLDSLVSEITLLKSDGDLFESTCENLALAIADADYFLSMQADIYFSDSDFLKFAIAGFTQNQNLLALGSRAVLPINSTSRLNLFFALYKVTTRTLNWITSKSLGVVFLFPRFFKNAYFGDVSSPPRNKLKFSKTQSKRIYPGAYLIRGPIIWRTSFLRNLGANNDVSYFMGGDERLLCLRGAAELGLFVGYMPSHCFTNLWTGTSHNAHLRSEETTLAFAARTHLCDKFRNLEESQLIQTVADRLKTFPKHIEIEY